ncbi:FAD-dependent oxidoreductase [Rhodothermaceae bacterium RA]|nr:FAD-dependent oxidoreductase [Rhodothermaceae bacterium RA]
MTLSFWQHATREPEVRADVAIVGGGVVGCSTAYWLHRMRPSLRLVIVEAGMLAQGASGRNAGFLLPGTAADYATAVATYGAERARRLLHFTRENREMIATELRGAAFDLEPSGSLTVAGSAAEEARLLDSVSLLRADGMPVAFIPRDETNRRLVARGYGGALYVPSGAMLHPVRLVRHLAGESEARLLTHHRVAALQEAGGDVVLETPVRRIRAGQVVLALNAYLPQLVPALSPFVRPVRAQMLATEPAASRWLQVPVYSHEGYYYLRQLADGVVLLGGARHLHADEEQGYEDATTEALQADLLRYLHFHFPQARGLGVRHRWSGVMGFSPDHLPVVGAVPGLDGSVWAAGFTGHGMGFGFRFGRLLADVVLGTPHPDGLELFSVRRFPRPQTARPSVPAGE